MPNATIFSLSELTTDPCAYAIIQGGTSFPDIAGIANFYETKWNTGLLIEIELTNLPNASADSPHFLGLHLHENGDCTNGFANTGMHYNPTDAAHPYHIGDLPSILNSHGYAYGAFYDCFLSIPKILGRSVILHDSRDDFTSQPSGDSGEKIACGIIVQNKPNTPQQSNGA